MKTINRCPWGESQDETMQNYHDHEWGKLNLDDQYLYEILVLELFQSGLSWSTILHKRENFRAAFKNFDIVKVAQFTDADISMLLQNKGIIRNQRKITAAIKNAQAIQTIKEKYDSFAKYLQQFVHTPIMHHFETMDEIPAANDLSKKIAQEMKKAGFSFVGPVVVYSFLQAVGLINDHLEDCHFKYNG